MESQEVLIPHSESTETNQIDTSKSPVPNLSTVTSSTRRSRKKQQSHVASDNIVAKKKGKLRCIVELPIDVLLEIFGWLEPLDLYRISYATKDLRFICQNRQIWKQVWPIKSQTLAYVYLNIIGF